MKLLDFTGRKVDPSLLMGSMKESKKEQDPNIKVRPLTAAPLARWHADTPPAQIYRAYAPYVSVVLHTVARWRLLSILHTEALPLMALRILIALGT